MSLNFKKLSPVMAVIFLVGASVVTMHARADSADTKEKPRLYTYVAIWNFPRADWSAVNTPSPAARDLAAKSLASGKLVGVGDASSLMHHLDGTTHMNWWSSMTQAGLFTYLDDEGALPANPVLEKSTRHADFIVSSTHYNRKAVTVKSGYQMVSYFKFKADAPEHSLTMISKSVLEPVLEKLFAEGVLVEYQIASEEFQSGPSRGFWIESMATSADAMDKTAAAWREAEEKNPAFSGATSLIDWDSARDYIYHVDATLK